MNCDEFGQRMHQCLDDRLSIDSDSQLCRHAKQCESCRAQLHAWSQIATIMPGRAKELGTTELGTTELGTTALGTTALQLGPTSKRSVGTMPTLAGIAAAMLIAVTSFWYAPDPAAVIVDSGASEVDSVGIDDHQIVLAQATGELDPALWWRSVQDRDWVGQTMPAVQSVKDGVAPIGRSLIRAVTILTMGGHNQTS